MATSLLPHRTTPLLGPQPPKPTPSPSHARVRCGPRDNRGPLVKGRILSIEAIQAVQSLKRAHRTANHAAVGATLSRLIKADLLAALRELLRQDQCALALEAFAAVRSEYRADMALYADVVNALARNKLGEDVDRLIADLEAERGECGVHWDEKAVIALVRAVIGADRRESTVRMYNMLKRSVEGSAEFKAEDYIVGALSRGLRRLGEPALADEVVSQFGKVYKGSFDKCSV